MRKNIDKGSIANTAGDVFDSFFEEEIVKDQQKRNVGDVSDDNPFRYVDIETFCESSYFLGLTLRPWQKLILKIFYMGASGNRHVKLNDSQEHKCINCVWNNIELPKFESPCLSCINFNEKMREDFFINQISDGELTKEEISDWLDIIEFNDNFINEVDLIERDLADKPDVKKQILDKVGKSFKELVLVLGRRSGKSLLTATIALYEAYRLIEMGDPHAKKKLLSGEPITILNVAVAEDQAKESVFEKIKTLALDSAYFKTKINPKKMGVQSMRLFTEKDIERNKELIATGLPTTDGSIQILSGTSNSASQVGKTVAVVIMDEVAEMITKEDSKSSDFELYNKLKPSISTFGNDGRVIAISNPLAQEGLLWKLYNDSFTMKNPLMFQLPTKICNPAISSEFLEEEKEKDSDVWAMQYGAEFNDGAKEPLIPSVLIDMAFKNYSRKEYGIPDEIYFAHADPAHTSDNYAFVVLHVENSDIRHPKFGWKKKIIVDHIKLWEPKKTGQVIINDVDQYIIDACVNKFNIISLTYDQWGSTTSLQKMKSLGLPCRETKFTSNYIQEIYTTLLNLFQDGLIDIYEFGDNAKHAKQQFKYLQKKYSRNGFRIEAASGQFDDIPDCIASAAYQALKGGSGSIRLPKTVTARLYADPAERMLASSMTQGNGQRIYGTRKSKNG